MALPRLNETIWYDLKLPSSGDVVHYRPFLVKEQKVLLTAGESNQPRQVIRAITDTIKSCVQEDIDVSGLSSFDVDYIFARIRAKSVGETAELMIKCSECKEESDVKVDIMQTKVVGDMQPKIVQLTPEISIEMHYPTYNDLMSNTNIFDGGDDTPKTNEASMNLIISCMSTLFTEDERIDLKNESMQEKVNFLDSLNGEQFEKIAQFIGEIPKLSYDAEFNCEHCNHENKITLEGMDNFF
jgi:transcription elongation factor Elf1